MSTTEKFYVAGYTEDGQKCLLEEITEGEDMLERLEVWRKPSMSRPFNHDVHVCRRVTTVQESRVESWDYRKVGA